VETQLRAVIFVKGNGDVADRVAFCFAYCERRGYEVRATFISDEFGRRWDEVVDLVLSGYAHIIVVHSPDDPPSDRVPRIEVATTAAPDLVTRRLPATVRSPQGRR
jgi:hypothetical protein